MGFGLRAPNFDEEGAAWPHRASSFFIQTRTHRWHAQRMGAGQKVLLIHGTGASTHSFADLFPCLAASNDVMAVDLPAHGFTATPAFHVASPDRIAEEILCALRSEEFAPDIIVGHSAGAVLASLLALNPELDKPGVVSINGAYRPFPGIMRFIAPMMAKALSVNPLVAMAIASNARNKDRVVTLITQTGSQVPDASTDCYAALLACSGHVAGALSLMASWNLDEVEGLMERHPSRHLFLVGARDQTVPADVSQTISTRMPHAEVKTRAEAGHLLHEEDPGWACQEIAAFVKEQRRAE